MNVKFSKWLKKGKQTSTNAYLYLMFSLFLCYYQNYYYDITPSKYSFFFVLSILLLLITVSIGVLQICMQRSRQTSLQKLLQGLSITDWAMLALVFSHCLTTLLSEAPYESMTGSRGRQMGLNFTIIITFLYFIISRNYVHTAAAYAVLLEACAIITGLGILNFYGIDPFHFFDRLSEFDKGRFLSTIGNITFFADLMCLVLPFSIFLYTSSHKSYTKFLYGCSIALGCMGVYISNLDGAYLGMGALLIYLFCISCVSREQIRNFIEILLIALCSAKVLWLCSLLFPDVGRGFVTLSHPLVYSSLTTILLVLLVLLDLWMIKQPECFHFLPYKAIRRWVIIGILFLVLMLLGAIFYFSVINPTFALGSWSAYLRFDASWGTGRGMIWHTLGDFYANQASMLQRVFGYGLDTTRLIMIRVAGTGASAYDNAHNEYLQYLVTSGLIGLCAYLLVYGSLLARLCHNRKHQPMLMAFSGALIAHAAIALTGLNQPITTPLLFIFIALAEAYLRQIRQNTNAHAQEKFIPQNDLSRNEANACIE